MRVYYTIRIALAASLAAAAWISVRSARADFEFRRGTPHAVAAAVALEPANTEYLEFHALQLDYEGSDATPLVERAAQLNPFSSAPRIRLGLAAETRGDFAAAEKWLIEAARVDHQFEPRWTLASYYFRRGKADAFWQWMRDALEISYGDRRPAFDLCWRISSDAEEIFRRAIGDRSEVLAAYVDYLIETRRAAALAAPALKLAAAHDPADRATLLAALDALIAANSADPAWELWRAAGFGPVTFASPRTGRGFDWQRIEPPGVVHLEIDQPRSMHRITLSGNQPESCELLKRVLKLEAGKPYTLRWQAQPEFDGVEWRIAGERAPLRENHLEFTAPAELVPLVLAYQRPHGEMRVEGSFEIWSVEIAQ